MVLGKEFLKMKGTEMAWSPEGRAQTEEPPTEGSGFELGHMDLLWKPTRAVRAVGWALGQG